MKLPGVSIIVCCYNSKERLSQTIQHIALQKVCSSIDWEVVLVDNNSTDDTAAVAQQEWDRYSATVPFTLVKQPVPGLNAAREKGFDVARHEYIIFCDDDNWLSHNYINEIAAIFNRFPEVGVVGTKALPYYAGHPPEWFEKYEGWFALGTQGIPGDITNEKGYVWGAGMAIRYTALHQLRQTGYTNLLTDRVGNKMTTGGDVEVCFALRFLNYKIFYTEACYLKHYMPENRFSEARFFNLALQNGYSNAYLFCLYKKKFPSRAELLIAITGIVRKTPKRILVKYLLGKNDFEELKFLNDWCGFLQGHLFLLRNQRKFNNNFSRLAQQTDVLPVNQHHLTKALASY